MAQTVADGDMGCHEMTCFAFRSKCAETDRYLHQDRLYVVLRSEGLGHVHKVIMWCATGCFNVAIIWNNILTTECPRHILSIFVEKINRAKRVEFSHETATQKVFLPPLTI